MKSVPEGYATWEDYERAWAHVQCDVCGKCGIIGDQDFESVGFMGTVWIGKERWPDPKKQPYLFAPLIYAHRSCATLGRLFEDMRKASTPPEPPPKPGLRMVRVK